MIGDCKNMIFEIQVVNVLASPHNIMIYNDICVILRGGFT